MTPCTALWHRHKYFILGQDEEQHPVDGIRMADCHFGVHIAAERCHVTHLPSGKRLHPNTGFKHIGEAVEFAERAARITEWSSPDLTLTPDEGVELMDLYKRIVT